MRRFILDTGIAALHLDRKRGVLERGVVGGHPLQKGIRQRRARLRMLPRHPIVNKRQGGWPPMTPMTRVDGPYDPLRPSRNSLRA